MSEGETRLLNAAENCKTWQGKVDAALAAITADSADVAALARVLLAILGRKENGISLRAVGLLLLAILAPSGLTIGSFLILLGYAGDLALLVK
ncbi:MAG: hypothetical protein WC985_10550 [Thermoplasmata archaeon]